MTRKRSRVHPRFKTKYRVRNWPEYDRALVRRGDITVWLHEEALAGWSALPSGTRGRPKRYSQLAIETALALRLVYSLPWRQTEGLLRSLLHLLGLELPVPDHTTLSRRARTTSVAAITRRHGRPIHLAVDATGLKVFGQGEWAARKHGTRSTGPGWRKLHVGVDEEGFIVAASLTDAHTADASQPPVLLAQLGVPLASFTAHGAYDGRPVYEAVLAGGSCPRIVVPPPRRAVVAGPSEPLLVRVPSAGTSGPSGRDCGLGIAKARISR